MKAPHSALLLGTALLGSLLVACGDKDGDETDAVNQAPVADAGADVTGSGTERVTLNGGASYDPDGDPIVWHWSFDRVPDASNLDAATNPFYGNHTEGGSGTSFLPDAAGTFVVKLVVEDTDGAKSAADYVVVTIEGGDLPVADAGADVTVEPGETATLDGASSYDPLGRDLTYTWSLASKPDGSALTGFDDANSATPSLVPDVGGVYVAALTVNNGFADSDADSAYIYASSGDPAPPVAVAGDDIDDGQDCWDMALDGSGSYDPNGDPLEYMWSLEDKPEGSEANNYSFSNREIANPTFYPDISGTYTFQLAVNDGTEWSSPDEVVAIVKERFANTPPVVEAGEEITVNAGDALCSDAGYGTWECGYCAPVTTTIGEDAQILDAEGDPVTYQWTVSEGDGEIRGSATSLETTVYLSGAQPDEPRSCTDTLFRFELSAEDCPLETGSDIATVRVRCCGTEYGDTDSGDEEGGDTSTGDTTAVE